MSLIFFATITPFGYGFLGMIVFSLFVAYMWLKSSKKKENISCISIGFVATVIMSILIFPAMISIAIIENGTLIPKIALAAFWSVVLITAVYVGITRNYGGFKKVFFNVLKILFFIIAAGLFLVLFFGMCYFLYLRFFTHEKDDAPVWTVFLCTFFVAMLILAAYGLLIQSKEAKKKEKSSFYNLEEAKLKPESVVELNLANSKINEFPLAILQFKNLKFLTLNNNNISEIPNEINQLQFLVGINLSNNPISDLERNKIRKMLSKEVEIVF